LQTTYIKTDPPQNQGHDTVKKQEKRPLEGEVIPLYEDGGTIMIKEDKVHVSAQQNQAQQQIV
jgi:hypothetical protein